MLRNLWKPRTIQNLVGLDIDSYIIKLLKINSQESPPKVVTFAIAPVPTGTFVKNEIKNSDAIVSILKNLFHQPDLSNDYVAIAIPKASAIIKNVTVDNRLNDAEIESRAWVEANRNFPDLISDIHLDFSIAGLNAQDPSQLDLILVACRKDQIKPFLDILHQSNLTPKILDISCYALERALTTILPGTSDAISMLNLNFNLSTLIVSQDRHLIYAHDQSYDGQRLVSQIRKHFNEEQTSIITPFEKRGSALGDDPAYLEILKENLTSHLRHTMHFFYSSRPNVSIRKLILAGDCATVPHLAEFIQQETNIETILANPFANMTFGPSVDVTTLKKYAPTLALCCGLALSQLKQ